MPTGVEERVGLVDLLLKVTGVRSGWIKGESHIDKHKDEIDVESYRWGVLQGFDHASGRPSGKRQHKPFIVVFRTCVASPILYAAACRNEVLKTVVLTCRKAGGEQQDYMIWTLSNASICEIKSGYLGRNSNDQPYQAQSIIPYDEISFTFQKVQLDYKPQQADGKLGPSVPFSDDWTLPY